MYDERMSGMENVGSEEDHDQQVLRGIGRTIRPGSL